MGALRHYDRSTRRSGERAVAEINKQVGRVTTPTRRNAITEQPQPLTQAQDHDRRIGRLEGIAEQLNYRLDAIERAVADVRVTLRWVIGIQITTLIAIGSLLLSILSKLPG